MDKEQKKGLFWDLAQPLLVSGEAERGTMMGFPCLRVKGKFFASLEKDTNDLIVKLPAERVRTLIDQGQAQPFAPNGRTFREWALIPHPDEKQWAGYLEEAKAFVDPPS
ncbi:MAG: hypothetical protein QNJ45_27350 [Ardenticatenaceae bacterium]|nr:hypothetical protein [Ardenticatenaceae bacterium]